MAARKKPKPLLPAEQLLQRGNAEIEAHVVRRRFEQQHADRFQGIGDQPVGRESGRTVSQAGISPKTAYRLMGLHDQEPPTPHPHGQMELPGMTSRRTGIESGLIPRGLGRDRRTGMPMHALPDLAPAPTKWEHMSEDEQNATLAGARAHGVTPESMGQAFGAQLDQGHLRGLRHGMTPYASHFYSGHDPSRQDASEEMTPRGEPTEMQPRARLLRSAEHNEVPFSTQVLANAKTSPKAKFRQVMKGEVRYPNDEGANVAIQGVKAGQSNEQIEKPHDLNVTNTNIRYAAHGARQHLAGTPLDEVRNPPSKTEPEGSAPFGPKTGPYANSFIDPHGSSQFFVSDVHSGGAGMAPHIPHEAPFKRDESGDFLLSKTGKKKRDSSQREDYLAVPGIHALADHVARQEMAKRGLQSLSGVQATQWGEEQVSRAEVDRGARKVTLVSEKDAYRKEPMREEVHGQMDILGGEHHAGQRGARVRPVNVTEMPEGHERVRAEAAASAIHRNTMAKRRRQGRSTDTSAKALGNEPYEGWG